MALLLALFIALQYLLWFAEDGVRQTKALRVANQAQTEENAALNERNRALEADVLDLKNGLMAIEERARAEIGMVRHDETFYRILERPLPQAHELPPAKLALPARKPASTNKPVAPAAKPAAATAKPPAAKPPTPVAKPPTNPPTPR